MQQVVAVRWTIYAAMRCYLEPVRVFCDYRRRIRCAFVRAVPASTVFYGAQDFLRMANVRRDVQCSSQRDALKELDDA